MGAHIKGHNTGIVMHQFVFENVAKHRKRMSGSSCNTMGFIRQILAVKARQLAVSVISYCGRPGGGRELGPVSWRPTTVK